jgi:hypothetical protein
MGAHQLLVLHMQAQVVGTVVGFGVGGFETPLKILVSTVVAAGLLGYF